MFPQSFANHKPPSNNRKYTIEEIFFNDPNDYSIREDQNQANKALSLDEIKYEVNDIKFYDDELDMVESMNRNEEESLDNSQDNIELEENSTIKESTKRKKKLDDRFTNGRWQHLEHRKFIEAILLHGNDWSKVEEHIGTRNSIQARSHAQKFFEKMKQANLIDNLDLNLDKIDKKTGIKLLQLSLKKMNIMKNKPMLKVLHELAFDRKCFQNQNTGQSQNLKGCLVNESEVNNLSEESISTISQNAKKSKKSKASTRNSTPVSTTDSKKKRILNQNKSNNKKLTNPSKVTNLRLPKNLFVIEPANANGNTQANANAKPKKTKTEGLNPSNNISTPTPMSTVNLNIKLSHFHLPKEAQQNKVLYQYQCVPIKCYSTNTHLIKKKRKRIFSVNSYNGVSLHQTNDDHSDIDDLNTELQNIFCRVNVNRKFTNENDFEVKGIKLNQLDENINFKVSVIDEDDNDMFQKYML